MITEVQDLRGEIFGEEGQREATTLRMTLGMTGLSGNGHLRKGRGKGEDCRACPKKEENG